MCEHFIGTRRESDENSEAWGQHHVVVGTFKSKTKKPLWLDQPFDLLVSEILGSTGSSESMYEYLSLALHHIRQFGKDAKIYCVPQDLTVTAVWYATEASPAFDPALMTAYEAVQFWDGATNAQLPSFLHTRDGIALQHMAPTPASDPLVLLEESYMSNPPSRQRVHTPCSWVLSQPLTQHSFLVVEWTSTLWNDVVLSNTLSEYANLTPRNAATRNAAWGLFVLKPISREHVADTAQLASVQWRKGVPILSLCA
jgi:hypothetical protein